MISTPYLLFTFVLFAVAVLDLLVAYTPFTTLYTYVHVFGSSIFVTWVVITLVLAGYYLWRYLRQV